MILDIANIPIKGFSSTVCIIGAGAAGLTIARELLSQEIDVCLLESGGPDYDHDQQELNDGTNIGFDYYDLKSARLRIFGGTTAIWGGRCAELDPIDFAQRPALPYSGWPVSAAQMRYYYKTARSMLNLPQSSAKIEPAATSGALANNAANEDFEIARWEFDSKHDRFQMHNVEDIIHHKNATVFLKTTVTRLVVDNTGTTITSAIIKDPSGRTRTIDAQTFILAAGGLENPRLLLASNDYYPKGIGNSHDLVGRFFMEHPRARAGKIITRDPLKLLRLFR